MNWEHQQSCKSIKKFCSQVHEQTTERVQKVLGVLRLDFKQLRFDFTLEWWENPCKVEFFYQVIHLLREKRGMQFSWSAAVRLYLDIPLVAAGLQEGGQRQHSSHRRWVARLDRNVITPPSQCHTTQQNLTAASKWSPPNELTLGLEQCRTHRLEKYLQSVIFVILLVQPVQTSTHLWHAVSSGSWVALFGGEWLQWSVASAAQSLTDADSNLSLWG